MSDTETLLLDLKDIHEPLAPATSSALLLGLFALLGVLVICAGIGYFLWRRKTLNRVLQQELALIRKLNHEKALHQLARLLRRVMHHLHGDSINRLQSAQWLSSLDKTFATNYFTDGRGSVFGETLYRAADTTHTEIDTNAATQLLCDDLHKLIGRTRIRPQK